MAFILQRVEPQWTRVALTRVELTMLSPAKGKYAGGNPVCPRPTPTWQKGIGDFFGGPGRILEKEDEENQENQLPLVDDQEAGGSGMAKASRK